MKRLLIVAVLVSACGSSSPTGPTAAPIPQYAGTWAGTYTITGCTQTGIFTLANLCGSIGSAPPYGFVLTQSSRNVSGTFTLGSLAFGSTGGTVDANGSLGLSSTHTESGVTIVATWALNMPASAIAGTLTQVWTSNGSAGQATVVGTISTAGRTAAFVPRTRQAPRSVQDLIEAVSQP